MPRPEPTPHITAYDVDQVFGLLHAMGVEATDPKVTSDDLIDLHIALRAADFHVCEEDDR